jgi:hypothetical protein
MVKIEWRNVYKANKSNLTHKLAKSLKNLIRKGYYFLNSLMQVYFAANIYNLLVQLVCSTNSIISLFHVKKKVLQEISLFILVSHLYH